MRIETDHFVLCPLRFDAFHLDYESYMSSVEHLQNTFDLDAAPLTLDGAKWPANSDLEFAVIDAAWCHMEWKIFRSSFTYSALTKAEDKQLGCGYIFPCNKEGFEILCQTWVRESELASGFDNAFYEWFRDWVEAAWPFKAEVIAWPGREIAWSDWSSLPEQR